MGATIIAGCDAPPVLEPSERVFDFMTVFVERLVIGVLDFAVLFRRDAGLDLFLDQGFAKPIAVIAAIACQRFSFWQRREHDPCPFMIAHLTFCQKQNQRLTFATGNGVKLRVQAALCAPDTTGNSPFLSRLAAVR